MNENQLRKEIRDAYVFLRKHNHSISDATLDFMLKESIKALDCESIVKKVDPNNLPDGEVLGLGDDLALGVIYKSGSIIVCENDYKVVHNVTRYIEEDELMGFMVGEVKK